MTLRIGFPPKATITYHRGSFGKSSTQKIADLNLGYGSFLWRVSYFTSKLPKQIHRKYLQLVGLY